MKFVVSAAFQPLENLVPLARAAEEAGFEAISFSDHVVYPKTLDTPYPYTPDGSRRYDETTVFQMLEAQGQGLSTPRRPPKSPTVPSP